MAWQRADLWKLAHKACRVHGAGGTGRSAGQPGPWAGSFLPLSHTKEARGFSRGSASQRGLYRPREQSTTAFVKTETFHKSLPTKTRNIAGEKCKGTWSAHKRRDFLSTLHLWGWCYQTEWYRKRLVHFLWLPFLLSPFSAARSHSFPCCVYLWCRQG